MKKKFKNYKQKENDLWIYKPPLGLQGVGIKFMKSEKDFLKYSFSLQVLERVLKNFSRIYELMNFLYPNYFLSLPGKQLYLQ